MTFTYSLTVVDDDGNAVVDHEISADQAVKILAEALAAPKPLTIRDRQQANGLKPKPKGKSGPKGPHKTEKELAAEADQRHGRSRLDPEVTKEVEDRLISGESVAVICENVEVSAPTVYVIKARLKKEGRLT